MTRVRLALDPAVLAWALLPRATAARAALLQHEARVDAAALARLRCLMPALQEATSLPRRALWDLLDALLLRVVAVEEERFAEFLPLARRLAPPGCEATLALALALEVDAVLAAGPGFGRQDLVPVLWVAGRPRQAALDLGP